jgi:rhodanese-related sulfurtransferase
MENIPEFIANHLFLISLFIGILMLLLWNIFGNSVSGVVELTPMETTRKMNHEKAVMLDVRPEKEFAEGHILNAINIPFEKLQEQLKELNKHKDRPLILCCRMGTDSVRAARLLKQQGIEQLYFLKGGLQAWRSASLPLLRDEPREETT